MMISILEKISAYQLPELTFKDDLFRKITCSQKRVRNLTNTITQAAFLSLCVPLSKSVKNSSLSHESMGKNARVRVVRVVTRCVRGALKTGSYMTRMIALRWKRSRSTMGRGVGISCAGAKFWRDTSGQFTYHIFETFKIGCTPSTAHALVY